MLTLVIPIGLNVEGAAGQARVQRLVGQSGAHPGRLCQCAQRAPRVPDGLVHLHHPVVEVAVVELPAIDRRQWGRGRRQHHAVGRIVGLIEPRPAAPHPVGVMPNMHRIDAGNAEA
jgi:hypothetical protein